MPQDGSQISRVSGRVRSIAFDPTNANTVYIAVSQGGIWKNADITSATSEWVCLTDKLPTTSMGAVAVDPTNKNVLYIGSGEYEGGYAAASEGTGIYKSIDGGANWTQSADKSVA